MTYCIIKRDALTLSVADANDPRVGVYVDKFSSETFWDFADACRAGRKLAISRGLRFDSASVLDSLEDYDL